MAGKRYRLVTVQNGVEHISSVVLGKEEAADSLIMEAEIHERSGWTVIWKNSKTITAMRPGIIRKIYISECSPMLDKI